MKYNVAAPSSTIEVPTTDGKLFAIFIEDDVGKCQRVMIQIGKSGTAIRAWTAAMTEMVNISLENGVPIEIIAVQLSNIVTDKNITTSTMHNIRSGPDGFVYAINRYIRSKKKDDYLPFEMPWAE